MVHASFGGVGFLSATGELVENSEWGVTDEAADDLGRSPWLAELIRAVLEQSGPTPPWRTWPAPVRSAKCPAWPTAARAAAGVPSARPGRLRGVLYLMRAPGQPAFTAEDEERVLPISAWLEQGSLFEEAHLQAQSAPQPGGSGRRRQPRPGPHPRRGPARAGPPPAHDDLRRMAGRGDRRSRRGGGKPTTAVVLRLAATSAGHSSLARLAGLTRACAWPWLRRPLRRAGKKAVPIYTDWTAADEAAAGQRGPSAPTARWASRRHRPAPPRCFATPLRAGDQTVGILQC